MDLGLILIVLGVVHLEQVTPVDGESLWAVSSDPFGVFPIIPFLAVTHPECATHLSSKETEGLGDVGSGPLLRFMKDIHCDVTAKGTGCPVEVHHLGLT